MKIQLLSLSHFLLSSQMMWPLVSGHHERIVNGKEAEPAEFPYAVSLQYQDTDPWSATFGDYKKNCGGSLISRDVVLTAA